MEDIEIENINYNNLENNSSLNDLIKNNEEKDSDNESNKSCESDFLNNSFLNFNKTPDNVEDKNFMLKKRKREEEILISDKNDAILYEKLNKSISPQELVKSIEIEVNLIKKK